ncbi:helix-turn-helix transcriptional regulator [Trinickia acidisoli]|uniref:helix-turn-helix transcriptional regulator n=1 Tax=Trinickia acidisoli TaxID=2767482 RepID=UPI001A8E32B1|nr:helix-turn-helix transcriptional regulator [Trinickia acidisoli]
MYPTVYLALLSALKFRKSLPRYCSATLDGDFTRAYCAVDDAADLSERVHSQARTRSNEELTALADVSLVLGNSEEAEDYYRRAQKMVWKNDDQLRMQSCRNTGWLSLLRGRLGVAQRSFARVVSEPQAHVEQRIEAYLGMALAHHQLAQQQAADDALIEAAELADEIDETRFRLVIELLSQEFDVRLKIRASRALEDNAFWQSALTSISLTAGPRSHLEPASAMATRPALLSLRIEELHCMARLADGDRGTPATVIAARLSRGAPNRQLAFRARLDVVLAALAGGLDEMAAEMMDHLPATGEQPHRDFDYLYCMAKIAAYRGDLVRALKFYSQYTTEALRCLRNETTTLRSAPTARPRAAAGAVNDDVSARLPAKYRRAYRYIIENIDREDLTTREVAAEMNVTMRTIQLVFKRALGMTPCALIRSLRLEGIREALLDENGPAPSIYDTAARWGLKSRSTLAKGYRKHFNESPSETIVAYTR